MFSLTVYVKSLPHTVSTIARLLKYNPPRYHILSAKIPFTASCYFGSNKHNVLNTYSMWHTVDTDYYQEDIQFDKNREKNWAHWDSNPWTFGLKHQLPVDLEKKFPISQIYLAILRKEPFVDTYGFSAMMPNVRCFFKKSYLIMWFFFK